MQKQRMTINSVQVLVTYLGQKVVFTGDDIDCGVLVYPMGAVGDLVAIEADGKGGARALVIFDNDPLQDCVQVPVDDLVPREFLPEGSILKDVHMRRSSQLIGT